MKGRGLKALLLGTGAALVLCTLPAAADEVSDLKAQIDALRDRLAKIEAAQEVAQKKAKEAKPVTAGSSAGSWKLPGSNTSISFSGYVKGDFILDKPDDGDTKATFHAKQSRLRFDSSTPTAYGPLNTRIETDFYGGDSGNLLRLRRAYGSLGPVLAGQEWSLFANLNTAADTVDFGGPTGTSGYIGRRPQLRFTQDVGNGFTVQASVEETANFTPLQPTPACSAAEDPDVREAENEHVKNGHEVNVTGIHNCAAKGMTDNKLPTLIGALSYSSKWGAVKALAAVGQADYMDDKEGAQAFHFGAHLNVSDATTVMATINSTKGFSGWLSGDAPGAVVDGELQLQETMGGLLGISHRFSDTVRAGLYYGWLKHEDAQGAEGGSDKTANSLHATVWWSPVPQANIGLEFRQTSTDSDPHDASMPASEESASRIQLGVLYTF